MAPAPRPQSPAYSEEEEEEEEEFEMQDEEEDEWEQDRQQGPSRGRNDDDDDEDDEDGIAQFEEDEGEVFESEDEETNLGKQLASIPFGTLVKAQKKMQKQEAKARKANGRSDGSNDDDDEDDSDDDRTRASTATKANKNDWKGKGKARQPENHRSSKHAPTEMSSKKPVSRNRQVIEVHNKKARDPRFDSLSGSVKSDLFSRSYSFLAEQQTAELEALRKTLALARKRGGAVPEDEKAKLEDALQRMESREISRKNKKRDEEALRSWKKEEQKKREEGKKAFHLKDSDRKAVLLKAKFDVLAQDKKQLRKTIEKRRKKTAQKDKKLLPAKR